LRISEHRLGLLLLVRPQEDRPKGQKLSSGVNEVSTKRALSSVRCKYQDRVTAESPIAYHDIIADMSGALHDIVIRPEIAANVDSTGQNKSRHAVKRDGSL